MADDFFGPASDLAVTVRPSLVPATPRLGSAPSYFARCSSEGADDGTMIDAEWANLIIANLEAVRTAAGITSATATPGADDVLLASIIALMNSKVRVRLLTDTTFYVSVGGSDTTGAGTAGSPWATKQHAVDMLLSSYDLNGHLATIQVGPGADSTNGLIVSGAFVGGRVRLLGDTTTPTNCPVAPSSGHGILVQRGAVLSIAGFALGAASAGSDGLHAAAGGIAIIDGQMTFGACNNAHIAAAGNGAEIFIGATELVSGSAFAHYSVYDGGSIAPMSMGIPHTVALSGALNFPGGFAVAGLGGKLYSVADTYTGGCTGPHFAVSGGAIIMTNGGGANYFPGSITGTQTTGGEYI